MLLLHDQWSLRQSITVVWLLIMVDWFNHWKMFILCTKIIDPTKIKVNMMKQTRQSVYCESYDFSTCFTAIHFYLLTIFFPNKNPFFLRNSKALLKSSCCTTLQKNLYWLVLFLVEYPYLYACWNLVRPSLYQNNTPLSSIAVLHTFEGDHRWKSLASAVPTLQRWSLTTADYHIYLIWLMRRRWC